MHPANFGLARIDSDLIGAVKQLLPKGNPVYWATPLRLDHCDYYDKLENNITKMPREKRKFSPDFKAEVAMEACKGLDTVHTVATKYECIQYK